MPRTPSNIILIGMPGSGKSTIGVLLAKRTGRAFVDTDVLIQSKYGRTLQEIVDRDGYLALRAMEERVLLDLELRDHVIATGGSAVYSRPAMRHLRSAGIIVFLNVEMTTLRTRVHDYDTRGLAKRPNQSIEDLFTERSLLYRAYADITIDSNGPGHEEVCERIVSALRSFRRAS